MISEPEYVITKNGNDTYSVKILPRAVSTESGCMGVFTWVWVAISALVSIISALNGSIFMFLLAGFCAFVPAVIRHLGRRNVKKLRSEGGAFTVTKDGIDCIDGHIPRNQIHQFVVRNKLRNQMQRQDTINAVAGSGSGMMIGGTGAYAAAGLVQAAVGDLTNGARAAGRLQAEKIADYSYCVDVEFAGRVCTLCSGLSEIAANGLVTDLAGLF